MFKPRYYFCAWPGRLQRDHQLQDSMVCYKGVPKLPERLLRLAHAEYVRQCGNRQDYERMQERGGLSVLEVTRLLADYVERLGGEPTKPRGESQ